MAGTTNKFKNEAASPSEQPVSEAYASLLDVRPSREPVSEDELRLELEAISKHLQAHSDIKESGFDDAEAGAREISVIGKYSYLSLGGLCVALGTIGVLVPGLPTTVFMIVALWAFTKSSPKMRDWLYNHRHFGPALQNWVKHRSIPTRARQIALASLLISALVIGQTVSGLACLAFILFVCTPVASFLWTLPTNPEV